MSTQLNILLLGIGNVLWADEGFGVRVIERLQKSYRFPDNVKVIDGGTQGIYLIEHVQTADVLIVFDAIDYCLILSTLEVSDLPAVACASPEDIADSAQRLQEILKVYL